MNDLWKQKFNKILIDKKVEASETAQRFKNFFPDICQIVDGEPRDIVKGSLSADQFTQSKKQIYLTEFKGQFFKKCPGFHKGMACCNYFVLNLGFQCDMDCSYCYLQSFLNSNYMNVYTNIDQALTELRQFEAMKDQPLRVGTGEVIDSLSLDPVTLYSRTLIEFFKDFPNWKLEFKTKSAFVDQFLDCQHAGNIIVSWSVNPQNIIESEEHGTASLSQRLQAAKLCVTRGFKVSFHIDPMIYHPNWRNNYGNMVDQIIDTFSPHDIPYLSVGALRFQPEQKNMMRERFGMESLVTRAETFPSQDGKLRFDYGVRKEMFEFVLNRFRANNKRWRLFMCMETPETWIDTFGHNPHHEKPLKDLFQPIREQRTSLT